MCIRDSMSTDLLGSAIFHSRTVFNMFIYGSIIVLYTSFAVNDRRVCVTAKSDHWRWRRWQRKISWCVYCESMPVIFCISLCNISTPKSALTRSNSTKLCWFAKTSVHNNLPHRRRTMDGSVVFARRRQCAPTSNTCSLRPPESTSQTASRSVQPSCMAHDRDRQR